MDEQLIKNLFSIPILKTNIGREIAPEEQELIRQLAAKVNNNPGNYTSAERKILDTSLPEIRQFIEDFIFLYVDQVIAPIDDLDFYITQSWINFTQPSGFHHRHHHPNSFLSGVFYFNTNPNNDEITFFRPIPNNWHIPPKQFNAFNSQQWTFKVTQGDLIIFPSNLEHTVNLTKSQETRISLAFNVFFSGEIGKDETLTKLRISR